MGRIRSMHPGYNRSEDIAGPAGLSYMARLHFSLLWGYCDDDGRGRDSAALIKAECWPLDDDITARKVEKWQTELEAKGRIVRYEVDGRRYFQVCKWSKWQRPQKHRPSEIPPPPLPPEDGSPTVAVSPEGETPTGEVEPVVVVGVVEGEGEVVPAPAKPSHRARDRLFEAVCEAEGTDWSNGMTNRSRQAINAAVADLRSAGADPDDVPVRAARYRRRFPDAPVTANALAKHWPKLGADVVTDLPRHQRGVAEFLAREDR